MKWEFAFGILFFISVTNADKLLRVTFQNAKLFQQYAMEKNLDIWSERKDSADVVVSPDMEEEITSTYKTTVIIPDVDKNIDEEMKENRHVTLMMKRFRSITSPINYFAQFNVIVDWMEKLARSNRFVTVKPIGRTYENREMKLVRVGIGAESNKPAVFVMAGIHAREWLAVASTVYFLDKLTKGAEGGDARIMALLNKYDFYVLPVSNPDGYIHTFESRRARSWRKTRRPHYHCIGADPNRNFDIEFGKRGASRDPCNLIYPGPHAFSENCVVNIKNFALSSGIRNRIKLFYDVHAYSQMYFVPFAHDRTVKPADDYEMRRVAKISNRALLQVNHRMFRLGSPGEILYDASGSTMDWFKLRAGVKYSYAFEVFPDMYSHIGFLARPADIRPSGEEISAAILKAAEVIIV